MRIYMLITSFCTIAATWGAQVEDSDAKTSESRVRVRHVYDTFGTRDLPVVFRAPSTTARDHWHENEYADDRTRDRWRNQHNHADDKTTRDRWHENKPTNDRTARDRWHENNPTNDRTARDRWLDKHKHADDRTFYEHFTPNLPLHHNPLYSIMSSLFGSGYEGYTPRPEPFPYPFDYNGHHEAPQPPILPPPKPVRANVIKLENLPAYPTLDYTTTTKYYPHFVNLLNQVLIENALKTHQQQPFNTVLERPHIQHHQLEVVPTTYKPRTRHPDSRYPGSIQDKLPPPQQGQDISIPYVSTTTTSIDIDPRGGTTDDYVVFASTTTQSSPHKMQTNRTEYAEQMVAQGTETYVVKKPRQMLENTTNRTVENITKLTELTVRGLSSNKDNFNIPKYVKSYNMTNLIDYEIQKLRTKKEDGQAAYETQTNRIEPDNERESEKKTFVNINDELSLDAKILRDTNWDGYQESATTPPHNETIVVETRVTKSISKVVANNTDEANISQDENERNIGSVTNNTKTENNRQRVTNDTNIGNMVQDNNTTAPRGHLAGDTVVVVGGAIDVAPEFTTSKPDKTMVIQFTQERDRSKFDGTVTSPGHQGTPMDKPRKTGDIFVSSVEKARKNESNFVRTLSKNNEHENKETEISINVNGADTNESLLGMVEETERTTTDSSPQQTTVPNMETTEAAEPTTRRNSSSETEAILLNRLLGVPHSVRRMDPPDFNEKYDIAAFITTTTDATTRRRRKYSRKPKATSFAPIIEPTTREATTVTYSWRRTPATDTAGIYEIMKFSDDDPRRNQTRPARRRDSRYYGKRRRYSGFVRRTTEPTTVNSLSE